MHKNSWYLLRFLRAQLNAPWLCVGDFNEVLEANEQFGGNEREQWQMDGFQKVVHDCGFVDFGFSGLPYTWDNRQDGGRNVKVRLDRGLGDHRFLELMGETVVKHIPLAQSDHCALLVEIRMSQGGERKNKRRNRRPFRYENMWQRHDNYLRFVERTWDPGPGTSDLSSVASSLAALRSSLSSWDKEVFGSVKEKIKSIREKLEEERSDNLYRGPTVREKNLMAELSEVLMREEMMERQHSRVEWLREGDRNTGYFQAKAKARARTNRIRTLRSEDGTVCTTQKDLQRLASNFYQQLFTAQADLQPEKVCDFVPRRVSEQMNEMLCQPFTPEEVEVALFQMGPNKAPGEDGFTAGFFQKHWALMKENVTVAVLGFLNGGELPEQINRTVLVLIPKVANPQELTQFRPISLCNVLYKLC